MEQSRKRRTLRAVGLPLGILAGVLGVVYLIKPPCLILAATGLTCPGCGAQRMIWALFRGDFAGAFRHNPFLFVLTPFLLAYGGWEAVRYARGKETLFRRRAVPVIFGVIAVAAVVFMVLRNQPGFEFLGP